MRKTILYAWVALCLTGATLALMPSSWLPASWKGFVSARGTFDGESIQIAVPKHLRFPAKAEATITMDEGVCAVSLQSSKGEKQSYSVGVLLGGTVNDVTWTLLSGEEPHVSFRSLPPEASPWMSAAGTLFPMALAIIVLTAWIVFAKRMPWYLSATLASIGLAWLITTLGAIFDVINYDTLPYNHMGALAWHLGLRGWSMILFVLSPLALALVMYGLFGYRLRGIMTNRQTDRNHAEFMP